MATTPVIVGTMRRCNTCGVPKYSTAFGKGKASCKDCRNKYSEVERRAQLERMKAWRERRRAEQSANVRGKRALPDRFAASVATLERTWGPYATWTRDKHAQHSTLLRAASGVPEDVAPDARKVAA